MENDNRNLDFDRFSFRRVGVLLKKRFVTTRRSLLLQIVVVFGIMILAALSITGFAYLFNNENFYLTYGVTALMLFVVYMIVLSFFTAIAASLTFNGIRTKSERSITLMDPATVGERMLADSVFTIFLPPLIITIIYLLAECFRMFFAAMIFDHDTSLFSLIAEGYQIAEFKDMILISVFGLIMQQTLYLLGSVVWPRLSFLKTFAVLQVAGYLMLMIVGTVLIVTDSLYFDTSISGFWAFVTGSILFAVASVVIAYKRYQQLEIIQRW